MNNIYRGFVAAFIAFSSLSSVAADPFAGIVSEVLSNNPELKAERHRLDAGVAAERAENMLADPTVDFSYKWGPAEAGDKIEAGISQEFDWPGVYGARRRAVAVADSAARELLRGKQLDCALQVRLLLIDIVNCRSRLDLVREAVDNLDGLARSKAVAFEHGEATVFDIKNIEMRRLSLSLRAADTESQLDALKASLFAMNGGKYIDTDSLTDYPDDVLHEESYYLEILENSEPALRAGRFGAEAARGRMRVERMKRLPGFSVGYNFVREGGANFNGLSVGLRLPVWSKTDAVKAAELLAEAESDGLAALMADRRAAIVSDYAAARRLAARCESFRQIMGSEKEYNRLLRKALDGGSMTMLQYLAELANFIDLRTEYLNLRYSYASALARLNRNQ